MIKSKFAKRAGVLLTTLALSGCYDGESESVTDQYAHNLIVQTESDQSLVGQYHTMVSEDGSHLGTIYINSVEETEETGITCVRYNAWTYENSESAPSGWREHCLSAALKPN